MWTFYFCPNTNIFAPPLLIRDVHCQIFRLGRAAAQFSAAGGTAGATGGCRISIGGVRRIRRPGGNTENGK
jgi:hypothetical protein